MSVTINTKINGQVGHRQRGRVDIAVGISPRHIGI